MRECTVLSAILECPGRTNKTTTGPNNYYYLERNTRDELHTDRQTVCVFLWHVLIIFAFFDSCHSCICRWRCADKDILACRTCGGVTALTTLPSGGLSVSAIHQVYQTYRQQLATSHHMDCPFRFAAEQYLVTKPTSTTTINDNDVIVLPTPFCSVLDPEIVALVEAPFPRRLLEQRLAQLQDELPSRTCLSRQNFVIPPEMETYCGEEEEAQSSESSSILQSLTIQNILGTQDRSLLALALLGWRPRPRPSVMDTTTLSLTCPVCLAGLEIDLTTTTTTSTTTTTTIEEEAPPRATKRIKRPNPLEAHRYYCPIVCGFPTTTPVTTTTTCKTIPFWKVWLSRLDDETSKNNKNQDTTPTGDAIDTNEEEDTTTRTTHRILQVLQMGLTPQKVTL